MRAERVTCYNREIEEVLRWASERDGAAKARTVAQAGSRVQEKRRSPVQLDVLRLVSLRHFGRE